MSIITPYLYMLRSECLRLMLGTVTFKERAFVAFSSLITILIALLFCHKTWLLNQNLYTRPPYFQRTDTDNKTIWKAEMMTAEKFKEYFNIWSNLLIEGLDMLSREENLELVHVQDVFEHILQSKRELEAGLRGSLRATDAAVSRMRAELGGAAEDLERTRAGQEKLRRALCDVRVTFEKALQELEVSTSLVLKENVTAVSQLQHALQRKSEDMEELQKCLAGANKEMALMELQFTEHEAKFKDQEAKGLGLSRTLEAKERELQGLHALEEGRALELLGAKAAFEDAKRELEAEASRLLAERDAAVSRLQEATRKNAQDAEEARKLLVEARAETAHKETLLRESEVKLGDQTAKVQNLAASLEEKDQELQKQHAVQKRREVEIRDVRVAFEKAVLELESNASCVLRENELMLSQLQGTPSGKSEDLEDLQNFLVETAREELTLPQHELKMEDHRSEGHNLTTTLEGKGPELPHKVELQGLRRHGEEMLQARDHLCKEATESRKYPETDAEKERWREQPGGESGGAKSFGEEAETAEEGLRKTPALLHSVSQTPDQDWDHCATWWQILEGKETAKAGRRQKEEQAKMLRAKIHLKVKNGPCQIQLL
ncbi:myosin heavy chain, fast skeletal muscle-like isoform X3 [Anguilla anguilla]|uniref:myosin heavy chain, fast skeletal muscle-like isoform X3 n=1 Tax=Anguilla anguilla TaxID=7936 RepID=UPI0015AC5343|nr:myosin heavy chain, fast skeletal muscle-like isoform X3 [Anguilla anguilla]